MNFMGMDMVDEDAVWDQIKEILSKHQKMSETTDTAVDSIGKVKLTQETKRAVKLFMKTSNRNTYPNYDYNYCM